MEGWGSGLTRLLGKQVALTGTQVRILYLPRITPYGGTGRHAVLKRRCRKACRFDSYWGDNIDINIDSVSMLTRKGGRVVYAVTLLRWSTRKRAVGSNPTLSANAPVA
jgi:hypothetical protein